MKALFLDKKDSLSLRDEALPQDLGEKDVRIKIANVGICGSDVHYCLHGNIGNFVVKEPMVLGHEASGTVIEVGSGVKHLRVGDRVCMEPGIPDYASTQTLKGMYNLDPEVRFWATPPIHGCLRESIVHPASLTFKLPDNVSFEEGALVEPLAIGVHSAKKARIVPGDTALVLGAGTIGLVTALSAVAAGCSHVILADSKQQKLDFVRKHYDERISTFNIATGDLKAHVAKHFPEGVDIVFEASGSAQAILSTTNFLCPGGKVVLIGMPSAPAAIDIVEAQTKEVEFLTIFRYANVYDRAIKYIASGQINVKPLITHRYDFADTIKAFNFAATMPPDAIKIMIKLPD
ncbi:NAD(P)-dependent alcohol dehydrogenase [Propionivibrio soli]|uniref:NAD(P)-dependent alcohol dehydrogenase n=1 Tax=Propionivibrio soli TaxID=2976531 RepID=UPI0021E78576|nr:NAD(P)-dependent alcohol dehydrogenase [Propionivibrio soli]